MARYLLGMDEQRVVPTPYRGRAANSRPKGEQARHAWDRMPGAPAGQAEGLRAAGWSGISMLQGLQVHRCPDTADLHPACICRASRWSRNRPPKGYVRAMDVVFVILIGLAMLATL